MTSRFKNWITVGSIGTLVVLLAAVAVCIRSPVWKVAYHDWQMQRAHNAFWGKTPDVQQDGLVGYTLDDTFERYEHHRQRLVELGHIAQKQYLLEHILVPTEESKDLSRKLMSGECPPHIDFVSTYPEIPEPMRLTIWCYREHSEEWDRFIAGRDLPEYRELFMGQTP